MPRRSDVPDPTVDEEEPAEEPVPPDTDPVVED